MKRKFSIVVLIVYLVSIYVNVNVMAVDSSASEAKTIVQNLYKNFKKTNFSVAKDLADEDFILMPDEDFGEMSDKVKRALKRDIDVLKKTTFGKTQMEIIGVKKVGSIVKVRVQVIAVDLSDILTSYWEPSQWEESDSEYHQKCVNELKKTIAKNIEKRVTKRVTVKAYRVGKNLKVILDDAFCDALTGGFLEYSNNYIKAHPKSDSNTDDD